MSMISQHPVLLSTFYCGKKKYKLYFHRRQIVWDNERPPYARQILPIENVIAIKYNRIINHHDPTDDSYDPLVFTIHYAERADKIWKYNYMTLRHSDPAQVSSWVKTLETHLESFNRPRNLLLFVNPYGGKRKALKVFNKFGKPLFNIAGVDVSVLVSQRQNQIKDIVIHHNLDMFDSVGCVGGDGTVSELFNGLVLRECNKLGIDPNNIDQELPQPSFPMGIIPGGSTDTIAYCVHGTTDVQTAVLNIIFGDHLGLDLVSVYEGNHLLRLYASVLSYGYLGDIALHSERLRWMGPQRYNYCGFKKLMANKGYKGQVTMLSTSNSTIKCFENCDECLKKCDKSPSPDGNGPSLPDESAVPTTKATDDQTWKTVEGKFFMISGANISCACDRSPSGIAPYGHLGDGNLHLVLVRHTSLFNNLRLLQRLTKLNYSVEDLSFVEIHRAKEFAFRAAEDRQSRWNCDGEVQGQTDIHAKVRCQLLKVFSRGGARPTEKSTTCCECC